jgi:hypothetical protein
MTAMTNTDYPPSLRQLLLLALILFTPLVFTFWAMSRSAPQPGALATVGVVTVGFMAILYFVAARHAVDVTPERLTIRHSVYTLKIERSQVTGVSVRQADSVARLGLAIRTNGIAAFGYYSGWFRRSGNHKVFCAVSQGPLYLLDFEGSAKCRQLALSASPETIRRIEDWARQ